MYYVDLIYVNQALTKINLVAKWAVKFSKVGIDLDDHALLFYI